MEPFSRVWLSLLLVVGMVAIMHAGEQWMLRFVKILVYPLVAVLFCISLYLVPSWNSAAFDAPISGLDMLITLFITTPLLIFSFNHSPACSAFAQAYRKRYGNGQACIQKTSQILGRNTLLLLVVILFFVFSCVLTLTPEDLGQAKALNVPVLSVLASSADNPVFAIVAPIIAFLAIASSYFGVYLGTLEGLQGLVTQQWLKHYPERPINNQALRRFSALFLILTCWGTACANWSVISMVEALIMPVLATILYLMPVYAFYRVDRLKHYRSKVLDGFVFIVGIMAISGFLVEKLF